MRMNIRSKLVFYTILPVLGVYTLLFWLGISQVRAHLSDDAQRSLTEHARHQASRLALVLSQIPALAESLGDLALAEPGQPQAVWYAHLIDGLRRTPIAQTIGVAYREPPRGAMMRRGALAGQAVDAGHSGPDEMPPGWQIVGEALHFNRAIYLEGERIGGSWVVLSIADLYAEIERWRESPITLFVSRGDGILLPPGPSATSADGLLRLLPLQAPADRVHEISEDNGDTPDYWVVNAELPGLPWRITAVTPSATALQRAQHEASTVAGALLLSLLAIVGTIGIATRQITRPLATLDASVRQIALGNFAVEPKVESHDELAGLAAAIRRMARHIADRENQLRAAQQALEQRVRERTAALQQSNDRLTRQIEETRRTEEALRLASEQAQQANRAKSEFLSHMSHELRTPLHGVLGYTQILRRDTPGDSVQRESLDAIERCGQHLLTLINDILDLTKIEAGRMQIDPQPTDLVRLVEDVRTIIVQRAASKGLQLSTDIAGDVPDFLLTDPVKLKQILLNLLGNAVKFTHQGSVALRVERLPEGLCFTVSDTGVGISADKVEAIFEAFNQVRGGRMADGSGLGLTINQRLITLLGGQALQVESTPGAGSRFRFCIPCRPATPAQSPDQQAPPLALRSRLTADRHCAIMVIDAQAESRNVVSSLLSRAGCEVESFTTVDAATERLQSRLFGVVLCDIRLPASQSQQLAAQLRDQARFGEPRLIGVSANVFAGAAQLAAAYGFDGFLGKPFTERQLFDLLEAQLAVSFVAAQPTSEGPPSVPPDGSMPWPTALAAETARQIHAAIDLGDVALLFQLAEELQENPLAPRADVEQLALMARLFDFDGLRQLSQRLSASGAPATPA